MHEHDRAERCCPVPARGAEAVGQNGEHQVADLVNQLVLGSAAMASSGDTHLDGWSRPVLLASSVRLRLGLAGSLPRGQRSVGEGGKFSRGTWQSLKKHLISHTSFALKVDMMS